MLESRPYADAVQAADAPDGMLLYLDTPQFFEDVTDCLTSNARIGAHQVISEVPFYSIRKLLAPGTISVRTAGRGWAVDSTLGLAGNISLLLWLLHAE